MLSNSQSLVGNTSWLWCKTNKQKNTLIHPALSCSLVCFEFSVRESTTNVQTCLHGLATNPGMNINSPCSPTVQDTASSSCIYFCCSCCRRIWPISRLNHLTWFVVSFLVSLVSLRILSLWKQIKPLKKATSLRVSTDLDQSKKNLSVKRPINHVIVTTSICCIQLIIGVGSIQ